MGVVVGRICGGANGILCGLVMADEMNCGENGTIACICGCTAGGCMIGGEVGKAADMIAQAAAKKMLHIEDDQK